MDFIRTNILRDHTAATEVKDIDLPTNPISHLSFTLSVFNATDEATLAEIIAFINTLQVLDNGQNVLNLQSEDLLGVDTYLYKKAPILTNCLATDNLPRSLTLIVPFGRKIMDPNECYPARKKGELTLKMDTTVPATSCDNGIINIECIQLPGASPQQYLKSRLMTITAPGATGENDVNLPLGNQIVALQFRVTTWQGAAAHTTGVEDIRVLVDEAEKGYCSASFEGMAGDRIFRQGGAKTIQAANNYIVPANIFWADYDPVGNGEFLLDLRNAASAKAVLDMGVDEATNLTIMELCDVRS